MPTPLRAVLLATWGTAYLQGTASLGAMLTEVERDDEPHLICTDPLQGPDELLDGLVALRAAGLLALRPALPVPGDLVGLVGPPEVNQAALAAGEAVIGVAASVAHEGSVPALVPDVRPFGPDDDRGHCVTWRAWQASARRPDLPSVREAERDLAQAVRESTDMLAALGTTSWRDGRRAAADELRRRSSRPLLPERSDPRAEELIQRALQLLAITEAARCDDGGTVTAHAAQSRMNALAPLERTARRALVAAATPPVESASTTQRRSVAF